VQYPLAGNGCDFLYNYGIIIVDIVFEWDSEKALANVRKHGVTFDEAAAVFADDEAQLFADPDHSADEDRFLLLGMSQGSKALIVCHCYRQNDTVIRIISARKANRQEQRDYFERIL